jgi:hypothetical protein
MAKIKFILPTFELLNAFLQTLEGSVPTTKIEGVFG